MKTTETKLNNAQQEEEAPCRILFLEDSLQDYELMTHQLDRAGLNYIARHTTSKNEFTEALDHFNPDIIIADYVIPMFNGMHAFRLFREREMLIPFILATGELTEQLAMECLSEGVDDFILKSSFRRLPQVIIRNLEIKATQKEQAITTEELEKSNEELSLLRESADKAKLHEKLSEREFEILCMIASAKSIKVIAAELFLSPATVATYRSRLLEKLNLVSNVEITRYAIMNKLI